MTALFRCTESLRVRVSRFVLLILSFFTNEQTFFSFQTQLFVHRNHSVILYSLLHGLVQFSELSEQKLVQSATEFSSRQHTSGWFDHGWLHASIRERSSHMGFPTRADCRPLPWQCFVPPDPTLRIFPSFVEFCFYHYRNFRP